MTPGKRGPTAAASLERLVGGDVEVRTVGGGCHRGRLLEVGTEWLTLERHTTGRVALFPREAVVAIFDESRQSHPAPGDDDSTQQRPTGPRGARSERAERRDPQTQSQVKGGRER